MTLMLALNAYATPLSDAMPHMVDAANLAYGTDVVHPEATTRLRPSTLEAQLADLRDELEAQGCRLEDAEVDWAAGAYHGAFGSHQGTWSSGSPMLDGVMGNNTFTGADEDGVRIGDEYSRNHKSGKLVGDLDSTGYLAGRWVRSRGKRGVYVTLHGSCESGVSAPEALEDWFPPSLDSWEPLPPCPGNELILSSQAHVDTFVGCTSLGQIQGVVDTDITSIDLPNLQTVQAGVFVRNQSQLTTINLPSLTTVGTISFNNDPNLDTLDLGQLQTVTGTSNNAIQMDQIGDADILLPNLSAADGRLFFTRTGAEVLDLSGLVDHGDDLAINDNSNLTDLRVQNLETVDGLFNMTRNDMLSAVDLSALRDVQVWLGFTDNAGLETIDLSALETTGARCPLGDNTGAGCGSSASLYIRQNTPLTANGVTFGSLHTVHRDVTFHSQPTWCVPDIGWDDLVTDGDANIFNNACNP